MDEYSLSLTIEVKPTRKEPRKIPATPVTTKPSKIPRRIGAMPSISPARRNGVAYNDVHACPHECLPEGTEIVLPRVYNCKCLSFYVMSMRALTYVCMMGQNFSFLMWTI